MRYLCTQFVSLGAFLVHDAAAFSVSGHKVPSKPSFALFSLVDESTMWDLQTIAGNQQILRCEGQSRKTFNYPDKSRDTVQLGMESDGRPLKADVELWTGPDYTPFKVSVYSQDGKLFPIQSLIGTKSKMAQVEVRNTGPMEFPFNVACSYAAPALADVRNKIPETEKKILVQGGGAVHSVPLTPGGSRARVFLNTDGRNLKAKIELLNGPNNVKQRFEVYTSYGVGCSLYIVFDTPGSSQYTVRIINENRVEFPAYAFVSQFFDKKDDEYGYSG
jgi:hypothetical protein